MLRHSARSTVITTWLTQRPSRRALRAALVTSTVVDKLYDFANRMSPLGNATAEECADYCIVMFSDLTKKVTMQNLYHDGGFSNVGMSLRAMATYEKGLDEYKDENGHIIYG